MSDEDKNEQAASIYLTRAKMLPVEGVVYCLEHTAVHDDTTDPYGYGEPDCKVEDHRAVLYRARKGDIDETLANDPDVVHAMMHGDEQQGESKRADELPEGAVVTDSLTAAQEQVKKRVIAASSAGLSEDEQGLLAGLVRVAIRKTEKNQVGAHKLFGDEYDPTRHTKRIAFLEGIYRKLGKDPKGITNR